MFGSLESAPLVDNQDIYLLQKKRERKEKNGQERRIQIWATSLIQVTINHDAHNYDTKREMFLTNITEVEQ